MVFLLAYMVRDEGFEPPKWRSQSPLPYRLANPENVASIYIITKNQDALRCLRAAYYLWSIWINDSYGGSADNTVCACESSWVENRPVATAIQEAPTISFVTAISAGVSPTTNTCALGVTYWLAILAISGRVIYPWQKDPAMARCSWVIPAFRSLVSAFFLVLPVRRRLVIPFARQSVRSSMAQGSILGVPSSWARRCS